MIDDLYTIIKPWKDNPLTGMVWETEFRIIEKLKGFVKYDKPKIQTVWNHFRQELDEL
jgi:hypothetical protein